MMVFTQQDFIAGKCSYSEVGTTHEPRWATADADAGRCSREAVGTKRLAVISETTSLSDATEQAFNQLGTDRFFQWAHANPNLFFDLAAKHGFSQWSKQMPKADLPTLEELTDEMLLSLSEADIIRLLLKANGVTKVEDLE